MEVGQPQGTWRGQRLTSNNENKTDTILEYTVEIHVLTAEWT